MKEQIKKFLLHFWPWRKIAELEAALTEANKQIVTAMARYDHAYKDGYRSHFQNWLATMQVYHGLPPFDDGERNLMSHLYDQGYGWPDALNRLREYRGRGPMYVQVDRGR
jgi:hypothetical protein